jgi:hypothetical protein
LDWKGLNYNVKNQNEECWPLKYCIIFMIFFGVTLKFEPGVQWVRQKL